MDWAGVGQFLKLLKDQTGKIFFCRILAGTVRAGE